MGVYFFVSMLLVTLCSGDLTEHQLSPCDLVQNSVFSRKAKRDSDWNATNEVVVEQLFRWCMDDIGCARMYFQETQKNLTVFKVLLGDNFHAEQMQLEYAALHLYCNRSQTEEFEKQSWVSLMKHTMSNARIPLYCTVNEQLIFDSITMTYDCICMPHKSCQEGVYPKSFYYIIVVLFTVLLIFLFFGSGYYIVHLTSMYVHIITKKGKSSLSKTEAAIKVLGMSQL
jgi:hypothetical protein